MTISALDVPPDTDESAIPLPPASGMRALRRRRRRQVRRQRILVGIALLAAVGATVVAIALPQDDPEPPASAAAAPVAPIRSPRIVLAHQQSDGAPAASLSLLAPSRDGRGGSVVLLPPGTMTEVGSLGLEPIAHALDLGGPARLLSTVENLLGVEVEDVVVLDDAKLVALMEPYGALPVRIPTRVETVDDTGNVEILYEPGLIELRPSELPQLLTARGRDTELTMLARHQAFWQAFLERLDEAGTSQIKVSSELRRSLTGLVRGEARVRVLPVEALGRGDQAEAEEGALDTGGSELYQVRAKELGRFLSATFPDEKTKLADRPRVQVLNGTGAVEVAPRVAEKLVPAGMQITLTGNAARFNYTRTEIVFYDRKMQPVAERVRKALGTGRLVLSRRPLGVVDVTVIVGKDFAPK